MAAERRAQARPAEIRNLKGLGARDLSLRGLGGFLKAPLGGEISDVGGRRVRQDSLALPDVVLDIDLKGAQVIAWLTSRELSERFLTGYESVKQLWQQKR